MIPANELRSGIYVYVMYDGCNVVRQLLFNLKFQLSVRTGEYVLRTLSSEGINADRLSPIPLTEEILLAMGFDGVSDDGLYQSRKDELFQLQHRYLEGDGFEHIWDGAFTGVIVESVHQLQTLFLSLVGEELPSPFNL